MKEKESREFKYKSAKLVWEARTKQRIAQYRFEHGAGCSRTNISDWENGRRLPSRDIAWDVAVYLDIKWELMGPAWLEDHAIYEKEIKQRKREGVPRKRKQDKGMLPEPEIEGAIQFPDGTEGLYIPNLYVLKKLNDAIGRHSFAKGLTPHQIERKYIRRDGEKMYLRLDIPKKERGVLVPLLKQ